MALTIFLLFVFLICMAMLWTEGFWSNVISFINVLFAGILATNFYGPVANMLTNVLPSFTYLWDYISVWLLFAFIFASLRGTTDKLSKWRLRFAPPIETAGNMGFAVVVGITMVCFASFTLHMAPLREKPFRGQSFTGPPFALNVRPGILWLDAMRFMSHGALSPFGSGRFDPDYSFINDYAARRRELEQLEGMLAK